jgi:4-carboxymuconolactone decarboxylase
MAEKPTRPGNAFADIAPALGGYTTDVLFGDVWERPDSRSATVA